MDMIEWEKLFQMTGFEAFSCSTSRQQIASDLFVRLVRVQARDEGDGNMVSEFSIGNSRLKDLSSLPRMTKHFNHLGMIYDWWKYQSANHLPPRLQPHRQRHDDRND